MSIWKLGLAGALLGAGGVASAQMPVPNPFSLTYRAGFFMPITDW